MRALGFLSGKYYSNHLKIFSPLITLCSTRKRLTFSSYGSSASIIAFIIYSFILILESILVVSAKPTELFPPDEEDDGDGDDGIAGPDGMWASKIIGKI